MVGKLDLSGGGGFAFVGVVSNFWWNSSYSNLWISVVYVILLGVYSASFLDFVVLTVFLLFKFF